MKTNKRKRNRKRQANATERGILQSGANGATVHVHKSMHGMTEIKSKTPISITVPDFSLNNALTRSVRLHELIHARNPNRFNAAKKFTNETRQLCEDMKVHSRYWPERATERQARDSLTMALVETRAARELLKLKTPIETPFATMPPIALAYYGAARSLAIGLQLQRDDTLSMKTRRGACRVIRNATETIRDIVGTRGCMKTTSAANDLAALKNDERRDSVAMQKVEDIFDALISAENENDETPQRQPKRENVKDGRKRRRKKTNAARKFEVIELRRTIPTTPKKFKRRCRSSSGAIISTPRLIKSIASGQLSTRLYNKNKSQPDGGTILIDASGSMSVDSENLNNLCAALPFAQVAFYEGHANSGHLVIYAKDKKRAASCDEYPRWGGNDVDDFAVAWLLQQAQPLQLITDMGFTCPDVSYWTARVQSLARRGVITLHVCDVPDAIEKIKAGLIA